MLRRIITLVLIGFLSSTYYVANGINVDSLENAVQKLTGKARITALNDLCWELGAINRQKAYNYGQQALRLARENNYDTLIAQSYNDIGTLFIRYGEYDSALIFLSHSLKIRKTLKDTNGIASVLSKLGVISEVQGDYSKALQYNLESLEIMEKSGNKYNIGLLKGNIALIYYNLDQFKLAFRYNDELYRYGKELNNNQMLMSALANYGNIYSGTGVPDSALLYYKRALPYAEKTGNINSQSLLLQNIGSTSILLGRPEDAEKFLQRALEIRTEVGDKKGIASTNLSLAESSILNGNYDRAEDHLKKAYKLAKELGLKEKILSYYRYKSLIHQKTNDYDKALAYKDSVIFLSDSLKNADFSKQIAEMETKYETEKKEKENIALKHKAEVEAKKKEKQQVISIAATGGAILILLFAGFIYNRLKVTRNQKIIIEEKNQELNQTNEEVMAQRDQIEGQKNIIEKKHTEIQHSINYAKRIQTAILPPASLIKKHLPDSFVLYIPKDVVAGDFYWLEHINDTTFFAVADCTGHGVPGAMVSVVCHGALNRCVREYSLSNPAEILNKTREIVLNTFEKSEEQVKDGMDISLIALRSGSQQLHYAGANNPLYILRNGHHDMEVIKADKQPIGYSHRQTDFTSHTLAIAPGDYLYLFSDGFPDQFGGKNGKKLGYKQFREMLVQGSTEPLEGQKNHLNEFFAKWSQNENQIDDVCVVGIRF